MPQARIRTWLATMFVTKDNGEPTGASLILSCRELPTEKRVAMAVEAIDPALRLHKLQMLERSMPVVIFDM